MMRRNVVATFAFCLGIGIAGLVQAQGQTVYEVRGPNGPVYSDKPMPGARAIELPPLNVMDFKSGVPAPSSLAVQPKPESGKAAAATGYRSLSIAHPEHNGSVIAPSAVFEVRLALEPDLLLGEGHAFAISLNGKPVAQRFTASEFTIPAEFWGDTLPPPNQRFQLTAKVVDRAGATLKEATPVVFTLRYAAVRLVPSQPAPTRPTLPEPELRPSAPSKPAQNILR